MTTEVLLARVPNPLGSMESGQPSETSESVRENGAADPSENDEVLCWPGVQSAASSFFREVLPRSAGHAAAGAIIGFAVGKGLNVLVDSVSPGSSDNLNLPSQMAEIGVVAGVALRPATYFATGLVRRVNARFFNWSVLPSEPPN